MSITTPEEREDRIRASFREIWNEHSNEKIAEDLVTHGFGTEPGDRETSEAFFDQMVAASPDLTMTPEESFLADDVGTTTWTATATHEGELMGIEPSGNTATVSGFTVSRHEDDTVTEIWMRYDALKMLRAMDAIPEPITAEG